MAVLSSLEPGLLLLGKGMLTLVYIVFTNLNNPYSFNAKAFVYIKDLAEEEEEERRSEVNHFSSRVVYKAHSQFHNCGGGRRSKDEEGETRGPFYITTTN